MRVTAFFKAAGLVCCLTVVHGQPVDTAPRNWVGCSVDVNGATYNGECKGPKEVCFINIVGSDSTKPSLVGAKYPTSLCDSKKNEKCCADVPCLGGHGHCMLPGKCKYNRKGITGIPDLCGSGRTVCCPNDDESFSKHQLEKFAKASMKCLGGRGVCRLKTRSVDNIGGNCHVGSGWIRNQCGKGAESCCPFDNDSEAKWEEEKLGKKCEFVKPISTTLDIDVDILMAFEKVESGGTPNSIRFECHMFNKKARASKGRFKPTKCTIKPGNSFSRLFSETGAKAFYAAYKINKVAAMESTSFGLFQIMGDYMIDMYDGNPDKALREFQENPTHVSGKLLVLWFSDESWGAQAANAARQIKSVTTERKHWETLVSKYNGPGQVSYYVGLLKKAFTELRGKCDEYESKLATFQQASISKPLFSLEYISNVFSKRPKEKSSNPLLVLNARNTVP